MTPSGCDLTDLGREAEVDDMVRSTREVDQDDAAPVSGQGWGRHKSYVPEVGRSRQDHLQQGYIVAVIDIRVLEGCAALILSIAAL